MISINKIKALQHDNMLIVEGTAEIAGCTSKIEITEAKPQGIIPEILILDIRIYNRQQPENKKLVNFRFVKKSDDIGKYRQVTVRYPDGAITIEVTAGF